MQEALNESFWNDRYRSNNTGWDLGEVSPPLKKYIDQLQDKTIRILIPGAGNAHEALYLVKQGFKDITVVDVSSVLIERLKKEWHAIPEITLIHNDFFQHEGKYDLIFEQTFFCAISPNLREAYVQKIKTLLADNGRLVGVLFDREFEGGPPFGGCKEEYLEQFKTDFSQVSIQPCSDSHPARMGSEVWIEIHNS